MPSRKRNTRGIRFVIYSLYFLAPSISAISPAMASIAAAYPGVDAALLGYVITITAIFQGVTALVIGPFAGLRISLKVLVIFASVLYVLAGCAPFFLADGQGFLALLASRSLFGIATGVIMPVSNLLVMVNFEDESQRASVLGSGNALLNVGTIAMNLLGGFLCVISWQTTFLLHLLGVVLLATGIAFLPSKREALIVEDEPEPIEKSKVRRSSLLPMAVVGYLAFFLVALVGLQPFVVYNAQFIAGSGIGDSVTAGFLMTVFSVGGIMSSLLFKSAYGKVHSWYPVVMCAFGVVAAALAYSGSAAGSGNIFLYGLGVFLAGVDLLGVTCYVTLAISLSCPDELVSTAMGFVAFVTSMGTFMCVPFTSLVSAVLGTGDIRCALLGSIACACIAGVTMALVAIRRNGKKDGGALSENDSVAA